MGKPHNTIKRHNQFKDAILMNSNTYYDYLDRFKKIATSLFEWQNLPDSMDARFIELCLYFMGKCAFVYDMKMGGLINTKCAYSGNFNIYGIPTELNCWSYSYNTKRLTYQNNDIPEDDKEKYAILVMNNFDMIPTAPTLELFAQRLAEAQRACDVNIKQQKYPRLILTDKKQELTMRNLINQVDDNELNIFADKNLLTPEQLRSVETMAPYVADKLTDYKKEIWNEALTFLGISNIDYKRERMISSETDSKNELINLNLQSYLITRKKACEEINKAFGTNIDVRVRSDLHNFIKEVENSFDEQKEKFIDEIVDEKVKEGINE